MAEAAGPYYGMEDEQVLARAAGALERAKALPVGSVQRAIQWAVFDSAMMELDRRAMRHILAALGKTDGPRRTRQGPGTGRSAAPGPHP